MLVNKQYAVNFGTANLEYNNIGENTAYSMYGDEFPVVPSNTWEQPLLTSADDLYDYYFWPEVQPTKDQTTRRFLGGRSFAVECSPVWDSAAYRLYRAFNGSTDRANNNMLVLGRNLPLYVTFYNPNPLNVTNISFWGGRPIDSDGNGQVGIGNYQIQGSNDNSTWTTVKSSSFTLNEEHDTESFHYSIDLSNNASYYKYYRIYITSLLGSGFIYNYSVFAFLYARITATERQEPMVGTFVQPDFPLGNPGVLTQTVNGFTITVSSLYGSNIDIAYLSRMSCDYGENYIAVGCDGWGTQPIGTEAGSFHYIDYEYTSPLLLKGITVYNGAVNNLPKDYEIQYWANDTWNTIKTDTNLDFGFMHAWYIDLNNTTISSTKWRFKISRGSGDSSNYLNIFKTILNADVTE